MEDKRKTNKFAVSLDGSKCLSYTLNGIPYKANREVYVDKDKVQDFRNAGVFLISEHNPVVQPVAAAPKIPVASKGPKEGEEDKLPESTVSVAPEGDVDSSDVDSPEGDVDSPEGDVDSPEGDSPEDESPNVVNVDGGADGKTVDELEAGISDDDLFPSGDDSANENGQDDDVPPVGVITTSDLPK